jgi:hypothetical protein
MKWLVALFALSAAACGPQFAVVPASGVEQVTAQMNGATLTAFAHQWHGDPYDLADYVTPIAVQLYNAGPYEVRVSFVDFALTDERQQRFAAVSPFVPDALGLLDGAALADPSTMVAGRGGSFGGGGFRGGGVRVGAPSGVRAGTGWRGAPGWSGGFGARGGFYGGFRVYGGYNRWYGPGFGYWTGPLWPLTSPWVVFWGPAYYPRPPSHDVLLSALPEGVLPPGASVTGFLYFQRATSPATRNLALTWSLHDARSGAEMGTTQVQLAVVPR